MLPAVAGASVGAEGAGKAAGPRPPTSAFLGLGHLPARAPHSQAESDTARTAPAQWFLSGPPGRGPA